MLTIQQNKVCLCPLCKSNNMVIRQLNDKSGYLIGCSGYPQCTRCVYLPKSATSVTVTTDVCPNCTPGPVYLINMKFKPGSMPTSIPLDCVTCVFCEDSILKGFISHFASKSKTVQSPPSSKRRKLSKSTVEKGQMKLDTILNRKSKKQTLSITNTSSSSNAIKTTTYIKQSI